MGNLFPDFNPSRDECFDALTTALGAEEVRIYPDASLLIHCYEMNAVASDNLLTVFEGYVDKVGVPTWAARETWEYADKRITKHPLKSLADRVRNELTRFRKEAGRYIDDQSLKDTSREEYTQQLGEAFDQALDLVKQVENHQPKADLTTKRLLPFIEARLLGSDLAVIVDLVSRTAATRMAHRIPPGFGDSVPAEEADDDTKANRPKGKQRNPHGDLIIWLEILQDCKWRNAKHLVVVTRDVTKEDWVYVPRKIRDERDRPQDNGGLVTLPHPLLVHEAKLACPALETVHVVSLEMLTHVLRRMRVDVTSLTAALQYGEDEEPNPAAEPSPGQLRADAEYVPAFDPSDMAYEPDPENDIDRFIADLEGEGWRIQNTAARRLEAMLGTATRDQRVQIGRGLVAAANDGALEPTEFLSRVLADGGHGLPARSDILIGALAETYVSETGDLKKPHAAQPLIRILFEQAHHPDLGAAYQVVMRRLQPQSKSYLALPTDPSDPIVLEVVSANGGLSGVLHQGIPLLELNAPATRVMQGRSKDLKMDLDELLQRLAEEFAVPQDRLRVSQPPGGALIAPENIGFVAWGPNTGTLLR